MDSYYLNSRYYSPFLCRFISADSILGANKDILSYNLYAYCSNNPVMFSDPTGHSVTVATAVGCALVVFLLCAALAEIMVAVAGEAVAGDYIGSLSMPDLNSLINFNSVALLIMALSALIMSAIATVQTTSKLKDIASRYGNGKCDAAAKAMEKELKKQKLHGEVITITFTNPYNDPGIVWSLSKNYSVGNNNYHMGVLYDGIVYCNIHPTGLPEKMWLNDFVGHGQQIVIRTPF